MAYPAEDAAAHVAGSGRPSETKLHGMSGVFKHLMDEHGALFALVKQLSMRSEDHVRRDLPPMSERSSQEFAEMARLYAALREIVQTEKHDVGASDLADAIAALDAINPGSPEWGPAFLQVSELVEAHVNVEENDYFSKRDEHQFLAAY